MINTSPPPFLPKYIKILEKQVSGTEGGTFTSGAWQTRSLNTKETDTGNNASLAANQITLDAGTYECLIHCPAMLVNAHQARLYNITDGALVLLGSNRTSSSTAPSSIASVIKGRFVLTASKVLEVQHQCVTTRATYGFGEAQVLGGDEVYTVAEFRKVG